MAQNMIPSQHFIRCFAGLVSLTYIRLPVFGLPHMHPSTPARSHYIGHLSPEWDPQRYVASVTDLAQWHAAHHGSVPLIVNTCGWIKVGLDTCSRAAGHSGCLVVQKCRLSPMWRDKGVIDV